MKKLFKRIEDIYNQNPWQAAFFYPIVLYLIISGFFGYFENLLLILTISPIFLIPIWVLIGLVVSKKKYPYVFSLIFIGLFLFGKFCLESFLYISASNATATNHSNAVTFMQEKVSECLLGNDTIKLMSNQSNEEYSFECSFIQSADAYHVRSAFKDHFIALNLRNPFTQSINPFKRSKFATAEEAISCNDAKLGNLNLSVSGNEIVVISKKRTSCLKTFIKFE